MPSLRMVALVCVAIAGLIYLVPVQLLLRELSRKKDDGGGVVAGFLTFVPLWLLLAVALSCVTADGGFDVVPLTRPALHALVGLAVVCMGILSFLCFEFPRHPRRGVRFVGRVPIHAFSLASLGLVVLHFDFGSASAASREFLRGTWIACASVALALCGGYFVRRIPSLVAGRFRGLAGRFARRGPTEREILAEIARADLERDFEVLLKRTNDYESRAVRTAALERLRAHPAFLSRLVASLESRSPENALAAVAADTFTPEEVRLVALPARAAIERFTGTMRHEWRYVAQERRKHLRRFGNRLFAAVAERMRGSGVDYGPALAAFEETFTMPEREVR